MKLKKAIKPIKAWATLDWRGQIDYTDSGEIDADDQVGIYRTKRQARYFATYSKDKIVRVLITPLK